MDEPIVRFDGSFAAIESPCFIPKGKRQCVGIHMVSCRGGSLANQAWQRRPFPLTETAKSYNNQGGWAKSSTTIEVIEPFFFCISQHRIARNATKFQPAHTTRKAQKKGACGLSSFLEWIGRPEKRRGLPRAKAQQQGKRYLHCLLSHSLGKRLNVKERPGKQRRNNDKNDESFRRFLFHFQEEFV